MKFVRAAFGRLLLAAIVLTSFPGTASAAARVHHIAIQVDENDPAKMNLALNNAANAASYYDGIGESSVIEIVAYGPGLNMLREDTSPVKERLKSFKDGMPNVTFSACNVTLQNMQKTEGHPIAIVPEARMVPSGAVRLIQLQEQGFSYLKP
jgi:intracellular sulfur oxidation DsrE/DsrF family protein